MPGFLPGNATRGILRGRLAKKNMGEKGKRKEKKIGTEGKKLCVGGPP